MRWPCVFSALLILAAATPTTLAAVNDKLLEWWLQQRVATLQARLADRPFEQIGWTDSFPRAAALAGKHRRPIFLFSFEGVAMDTGRC